MLSNSRSQLRKKRNEGTMSWRTSIHLEKLRLPLPESFSMCNEWLTSSI